MFVEVNGTRLWFDVDGAGLVPDGSSMRTRPTVLLVHGGPGGYDHSYFKPAFAELTAYAQVVYLDLRGHGRSDRVDPDGWAFEACADDLRAFCDALGITQPDRLRLDLRPAWPASRSCPEQATSPGSTARSATGPCSAPSSST